MGRVTGAHGIRGGLKVHSYAETTEIYRVGEGLRVAAPDGKRRIMTLLWIKAHGRGLRMGLEAIDDRTQAEGLVGSMLFVEKTRLPALDEDTYYWFELVGLNVVDSAGQRLGTLERVIPTAANDVYVVSDDGDGRRREILVPAVAAVVRRIDLEARTMIVDLPQGLI